MVCVQANFHLLWSGQCHADCCNSIWLDGEGDAQRFRFHSDFIDAKVPGLSGGNRDGYLLFMRNTKGAHVERAKWYQKTVFFPEIANDRKKYGKFDESTGRAIPDKLTAISASDSDLSQIEAVADTVDDYVEHKVIAVKQHAARTAVEQPADLAKVFMLIKRIDTTYIHVSHHTAIYFIYFYVCDTNPVALSIQHCSVV